MKARILSVALPPDTWLTAQDVAKVLDCSVANVGRLARSGALHPDARGAHNRLMFRYGTILRFMADRRRSDESVPP